MTDGCDRTIGMGVHFAHGAHKLKEFRIGPRRFSKKAAAQLTPQPSDEHESRTT